MPCLRGAKRIKVRGCRPSPPSFTPPLVLPSSGQERTPPGDALGGRFGSCCHVVVKLGRELDDLGLGLLRLALGISCRGASLVEEFAHLEKNFFAFLVLLNELLDSNVGRLELRLRVFELAPQDFNI